MSNSEAAQGGGRRQSARPHGARRAEEVAAAPRPRLRTPEAAAHLGVSASYLEKLRVTGGGPPFAKLSAAVSYAVADLDAWAAARTVQNTGEARAKRREVLA